MRTHRNGRIYAAALKPGASNEPASAGSSGAFALCCPIDDSGGLFMPALRVVSPVLRDEKPQRGVVLDPVPFPKDRRLAAGESEAPLTKTA